MRTCCGLLLGLAAIAGPMQATTIFVDNKAGFLSVIQPGYYLEDFESRPAGSQGATSINFSGGGFAYSAETTVVPGPLYVNQQYTKTLSTQSSEDDIKLTFTSANVTAVGGNFFASLTNEMFHSASVTLSLSDGTTQVYSPADASGFVGFVTSGGVKITSLIVAAPDFESTALHPNIDNLDVGTSSAVPEPATSGLVGMGLVAAGWAACAVRRR